MAIVKKTFPDHIFIKFGDGQEHQVVLGVKHGEFSGAHYAEIEYFVDDATGEILGPTNNKLNGLAQPLTKEKLQGHIDANIADIDAQLRAYNDTIRKLAQALTAATAQASAAAAALKDATDAHAMEKAALQNENAAPAPISLAAGETPASA